MERWRRRRGLCLEPFMMLSRRCLMGRDTRAVGDGVPRIDDDSTVASLLMKARCSSICSSETLAVIAVRSPGPDRFASASARLARVSSTEGVGTMVLLLPAPGPNTTSGPVAQSGSQGRLANWAGSQLGSHHGPNCCAGCSQSNHSCVPGGAVDSQLFSTPDPKDGGSGGSS